MKLITFTVPCYNSAAYMDRCVETLLPAGEDEDISNETELRKTDTRDETLQQMQQRCRSHSVFQPLRPPILRQSQGKLRPYSSSVRFVRRRAAHRFPACSIASVRFFLLPLQERGSSPHRL